MTLTNPGPTKREQAEFAALVAAEEAAGIYDAPPDEDQLELHGYIGPVTPSPVILRRLRNAKDWLSVHNDRTIVREIIGGCVNLLQQSVCDYSGWAARNKPKLNVRRLVELTISDVDASPIEYQMPWQLEQFAGGELVRKVRAAKACVCSQCGKKFYPQRRSTYCSASCRHRATYRRRKFTDKGRNSPSPASRSTPTRTPKLKPLKQGTF